MKTEIVFDVSGILDEETFHEYASKTLNFFLGYGYNLDAFWDCIMDDKLSNMPRTLIVEGISELNKHLPEFKSKLINTLEDYAQEHPKREVIFRLDSPSGNGIVFENE